MRVTDRMLFDLAVKDGARARSRLGDAAAQVSTGSRLTHPGADPAAAALVGLERARADRLDALAATARRAADELSAADGALGEVANGVARARELAVQLANGTYGPAERAAAAREVRGLHAAAVGSLNVRVGSRYVLGGFQDGQPPFDAAGGYHGDAGVREVEIAPGVRQPASLRADVAVKGAGGGVDVLAALDALAAALEANDPAAVSATLDALGRSTGQLAEARGRVGSSMALLDAAAAAGEAARDQARAAAGRLADADPIAATTALALAERALEASLAAATTSFRLSLLDRLK